jgi:DNA polymerase III subunit delta'
VAASTVTEPGWTRIVGQDEVRSCLAENLRAGRPAHAYLFGGPRGVGKAAMALEFAARLLCDNPEEAPCGHCPQCAATARLQHPDLHLVFPLPNVATRKKADDGEPGADSSEDDPTRSLADRIALLLSNLAKDYYADLILPKVRGQKDDQKTKNESLAIRIAQVRASLRAASLKPFPAKRKVFVIFDADSMNIQAQNALLKGLEEPPEHGFFLLTTADEAALLPTIRSRCQRVRLAPLAISDISAALVRDGIEPEKAEAAAALSGGSFSHARELAGSDLTTLQDRVVAFLRKAAICDPMDLPEAAAGLMDAGKLPDETPLELLALFLRDVAVRGARQSSEGTPLMFARFEENMTRLLSSYPQANFAKAVEAVDESASYLAKGYTRDYVLYALAIRLNEALGPRSSDKTKTRTQYA